jgi:hypothetical protein
MWIGYKFNLSLINVIFLAWTYFNLVDFTNIVNNVLNMLITKDEYLVLFVCAKILLF